MGVGRLAIVHRKCRVFDIVMIYSPCYLMRSRTADHGLWEWLLSCLYGWQEQKLAMLTASSTNTGGAVADPSLCHRSAVQLKGQQCCMQSSVSSEQSRRCGLRTTLTLVYVTMHWSMIFRWSLWWCSLTFCIEQYVGVVHSSWKLFWACSVLVAIPCIPLHDVVWLLKLFLPWFDWHASHLHITHSICILTSATDCIKH